MHLNNKLHSAQHTSHNTGGADKAAQPPADSSNQGACTTVGEAEGGGDKCDASCERVRLHMRMYSEKPHWGVLNMTGRLVDWSFTKDLGAAMKVCVCLCCAVCFFRWETHKHAHSCTHTTLPSSAIPHPPAPLTTDSTTTHCTHSPSALFHPRHTSCASPLMHLILRGFFGWTSPRLSQVLLMQLGSPVQW